MELGRARWDWCSEQKPLCLAWKRPRITWLGVQGKFWCGLWGVCCWLPLVGPFEKLRLHKCLQKWFRAEAPKLCHLSCLNSTIPVAAPAQDNMSWFWFGTQGQIISWCAFLTAVLPDALPEQNWLRWHLGIYVRAKTCMTRRLSRAVKFSRLSDSICLSLCPGNRCAYTLGWAFGFLHLLSCFL